MNELKTIYNWILFKPVKKQNSTINTGMNESGENNANWNILESKYKLLWCHLNMYLKNTKLWR